MVIVTIAFTFLSLFFGALSFVLTDIRDMSKRASVYAELSFKLFAVCTFLAVALILYVS